MEDIGPERVHLETLVRPYRITHEVHIPFGRRVVVAQHAKLSTDKEFAVDKVQDLEKRERHAFRAMKKKKEGALIFTWVLSSMRWIIVVDLHIGSNSSRFLE